MMDRVTGMMEGEGCNRTWRKKWVKTERESIQKRMEGHNEQKNKQKRRSEQEKWHSLRLCDARENRPIMISRTNVLTCTSVVWVQFRSDFKNSDWNQRIPIETTRECISPSWISFSREFNWTVHVGMCHTPALACDPGTKKFKTRARPIRRENHIMSLARLSPACKHSPCFWATKKEDFTLASPSAVVWDEASPTGMRLSRAHLTGVTPRPAHCRTAQRLCAHDTCELALTHLVVDWGEARSSAVVCNGKKAALSSCGNFTLQIGTKTAF